MQRVNTFKRFSKEKSGVLLCTDLASRGLDFPKVDIVIQYDCPCNIETYVHRVGRTARNNEEGESHLYLVHGEEGLLCDIQKKKWTMRELRNGGSDGTTPLEIVDGPRVQVRNIDRKVKALIRSNKELKEYGKKYLQTYEKFLMFSSRKYSENTIKKVGVLYDYFGIAREERNKPL